MRGVSLGLELDSYGGSPPPPKKKEKKDRITHFSLISIISPQNSIKIHQQLAQSKDKMTEIDL